MWRENAFSIVVSLSARRKICLAMLRMDKANRSRSGPLPSGMLRIIRTVWVRKSWLRLGHDCLAHPGFDRVAQFAQTALKEMISCLDDHKFLGLRHCTDRLIE